MIINIIITCPMDRSLGCVIGAFIGDSIGSLLEFKSHVSEEEADLALTMPGGGPFNLIPGQVTDDSELAIALARALTWNSPEHDILKTSGEVGQYDSNVIAMHYIEWWMSGPFDKGRTISNALFGATTVEECYKNAARSRSESNGGLMRITPLAVFCSTIDNEELAERMVRSEQSLTHSNTTAQNAAITYVLAIRCMIRGGTSEEAFDKIYRFDNLHDYISAIDNRIPGNKNIGHAKIAWSHAFYHLKKGSSYLEAMRDVLLLAGDTDTNCAIVGGLIGASLGFEKLQEEIPRQIEIFMKCRPNRPYVPSEIIELVQKMRKHIDK
jgi:ADP-ribosylglycohydrolase